MTAGGRGREAFVHVEFYITAWDDVTEPLFDALAARRRARGRRSGCSSTTSARAASPATRRCSRGSTTPASTGTRCCRSQPLQGQFPAPGPAQPPQAPGRRRRASASPGSQNLTEPGYNKPKNHAAGPRVGRAMVRVEGPSWPRSTPSSPATGTPRPTRSLDVDVAAPATARRPDTESRGVPRQLVPERSRASSTENNLRMFTSLIYSAPAPDLAHQPLLRPRRVAAVRRDHGRPARGRRRAVRQRGVRPVHGRPRPGVLLPRAARGRACGSTSTRRRRSCTPSTSPSTTTSR